jgi:outer membrane protein assembly factor BamB
LNVRGSNIIKTTNDVTHIEMKRKIFIVSRLLGFLTIFNIFFCLEAYVVYAQALSVSWTGFRHDSQNTGRSTLAGPKTNKLKWKFQTGDGVDSSPVIGRDGTIYIGSLDKKLYAIKPDGMLKWTYDVGSKIY